MFESVKTSTAGSSRFETRDVLSFYVHYLATRNKRFSNKVGREVRPRLYNDITQIGFCDCSDVTLLRVGLVTILQPVVIQLAKKQSWC